MVRTCNSKRKGFSRVKALRKIRQLEKLDKMNLEMIDEGFEQRAELAKEYEKLERRAEDFREHILDLQAGKYDLERRLNRSQLKVRYLLREKEILEERVYFLTEEIKQLKINN